ncbi:hypothetical protein FDUTEX481_08129 [Tolypothrix sp. PCC 7601]|nr:hypothetical protein FDUTEX481_08129 [Tolypothrix sp. PCC 7601]
MPINCSPTSFSHNFPYWNDNFSTCWALTAICHLSFVICCLLFVICLG